MNETIYQLFKNELEKIKSENSYRFLKTIQARDGKYVTHQNKKFLNLSSNDYLGFASDKKLHNEFYRRLNDSNCVDWYGLGSSSSRLLTGDNTLYAELEQTIARLYSETNSTAAISAGNKEALVFNSGYHANTGIIPALMGNGDLILSDKLNHASIIDGVRLSRAEHLAYDHLDYGQIINLLSVKPDSFQKVLIVSESVFSMNGDIADIKKLVEIKNQFNTLLYLDEAHAMGVFGNKGLGICERDDVIGDVDIIVGTFGKALGSLGAFAVVAPVLRDYLINTVRPFIFTTALPPVILNWNLFVLTKMVSYNNKREYMQRTARQLRSALNDAGFQTLGESHIIPVIFDDNERTIRASNKLYEQGFLIFPIRPPSVPKGSSRVRISLNADIEWIEVKEIPEILLSII